MVRFPLEAVREVRSVWPERLPLAVALRARMGWREAGRSTIGVELEPRLEP